MAKPKDTNKFRKKTTVSNKPLFDPCIEELYEDTIEFICPVRGKVIQKVWVKRFRSSMDETVHYIPANDEIDELEKKDDGLGLYPEESEAAD